MPNDKPKLGGTPEQQAAFLRWREQRIAEFDRRIATGEIKGVEQPPDLTAEDEEIFDRVWAESIDVIKRLPE